VKERAAAPRGSGAGRVTEIGLCRDRRRSLPAGHDAAVDRKDDPGDEARLI
jgi:hypothetical protein